MKRIMVTVLILSLFLCGCSGESESTEDVKTCELFAMDTFISLKAYGANAHDALEKSREKIEYLEELFNVTDSQSDVYKINSNDGTAVEVTDDTASLIKTATDISGRTEGAMDISIYPVLKEWGFTIGEYKVPDNETIKDLLKYVNYDNIEISGDFVKIPENYSIDLGSVAKGYTGDKVVEILKANKVTSALINLGGNVQTLGTKPDGSKWNIAIKNPFDTQRDLCVLQVADKAVITSGSYERYFTGDDGNKYWHIIDPKTGYPANNGLVSITVIGDNGTLCDSLSTALFVMGIDKATKYIQQHMEIEVIFVTDNMEVMITKGIEESIKMLDGYEYTVISRD